MVGHRHVALIWERMRITVTLRLLACVGIVLVATACEVATLFAAPIDARWEVAPGQELDDDTREFTALVTETACASARSSEGRITGPEVEYTADAIIITFGVRPLGGAQNCPSNPPTEVRVVLDEPIAGRRLLDGRGDPPVEPGCDVAADLCDS